MFFFINQNFVESCIVMIESYNPATLEKIGEVEPNSPEEMPLIIENARSAQEKWMLLSVKKRKKCLKRAQYYIGQHLDEIAHIISKETGKPKIESVNADIFSGITAGMFGIEQIKKIFKPQKINFGTLNLLLRMLGRSSYIKPRPVGII
ncbi:MAG: aldehyde dehydrogenase family protein, partial [Candidatus Lokiarchaeota archaeon]|nr:aldehyde dehydrogenase family protein [Candidatus Lokiarchaeota archaeon]